MVAQIAKAEVVAVRSAVAKLAKDLVANVSSFPSPSRSDSSSDEEKKDSKKKSS